MKTVDPIIYTCDNLVWSSYGVCIGMYYVSWYCRSLMPGLHLYTNLDLINLCEEHVGV